MPPRHTSKGLPSLTVEKLPHTPLPFLAGREEHGDEGVPQAWIPPQYPKGKNADTAEPLKRRRRPGELLEQQLRAAAKSAQPQRTWERLIDRI